ncbi:MAG: DUF4292 domain-containing protein [Deltaproteobacteria bacterium]|nr:DUF4292 domain-containing protein [Deltaproteobacteria bacterium]
MSCTRAPPGAKTLAPRAFALAALALGVVAVAAGCPHQPPLPNLDGLTDEGAAARARASGERRVRLAGTLKARLPGLEGVVASADLDVALQPQAMVSVAVRSFFEQPMQMFVTDGAQVTVYDATQGQPVFFRGNADAASLARVLPLPLTPREAVAIFLARPPLDGGARLAGVDRAAGTFELWLEPPDMGPCQVTMRATDDAVLRWRLHRRDGRPLLEVSYRDLREANGAIVPFAWHVRRLDVTPEQALDFVATDVTWNGPALSAEAFVLEPPPGTELKPLGGAVLR